MPFTGPISLGSQTPQSARRGLWNMGATSITSYPNTTNIGFNHPSPILFAGQPPSTLDQVFASAPRLVESAGNVTPESITAQIAGVGTAEGPSSVVGTSVPLGSSGAIGLSGGTTNGTTSEGGPFFGGGPFGIGGNLAPGSNSGIIGTGLSNLTGGVISPGVGDAVVSVVGALTGLPGSIISGINSVSGMVSAANQANALNASITSDPGVALGISNEAIGYGQPAPNSIATGVPAGQQGNAGDLSGPAIGQPGFGISDVSGVGLVSGITGPRGGASPSNPGAAPPGLDPGDPGLGNGFEGDIGDSEGGCFTERVEVLMADGTPRKITDVQIGERVRTYSWDTHSEVEATVLDRHEHTDCDGTPASHFIRLDGLEVTGIHPITVGPERWKSVRNVTWGDLLVTREGMHPVKDIQVVEGAVDVYDLVIDGPESFYARANGSPWFLVHNKSDCFLGDVRVLLADGTTIAMQDAREGMRLQGFDPETRRPLVVEVECRVARPSSYYFRLNTLGVTGKHKVYQPDGTMVTVNDIGVGDSLLAHDEPVKIWRKDRVEGDVTVYDLRVSGPKTFFVQDGESFVLVHNKAK